MITTRQKLEKLASETGTPCVTISLNTHRTHPDNEQDRIVLKNLLKEAENRVVTEFGRKQATPLLDKMAHIADETDVNDNLESLHIFLSNDTKETVRSIWPVNGNGVHISTTFALKPLIKAVTRGEEYHILLLSQGGTRLFEAVNDGIADEVTDGGFPFPETPHFITDATRASDPKRVDNMVREYLNKVDKAVLSVHNETGLNCVVICTEDNYSRLMQVADKPGVYHGYVAIDYNNTAQHHIARQSWELVQSLRQRRRARAIDEMKAAVAQGKVLTDLQEIYRAVMDGRGDLLIVHPEFSQPVVMKDDRNFELVANDTLPGAIDDITGNISWAVLSKNGRVEYTRQDGLGELGKIALKTRY